MRDELRERFFTPFVLPLAVLGVMLLIGISLSRILMAVPALAASFIALLAAGYILAMAFVIESRKRIGARALGVAMAVGLIGLLAAGAVAGAAGMRPLAEEHGGDGGEGAGGGEVAVTEPVFVAIDIAYESAPDVLPTGSVDVRLVNNGAIVHNVVIEELNDEVILEADGGGTDQNTVEFDAGEYTYFCDIPGHREAGMEGTLTVSDSAAAPSGDGAGATSEQASVGASEG